MEIEELFIRTLDDLEQRITIRDEYAVLMSSALLRKLLLDKSCLVDRANRSYRLKLRFRIGGAWPFEQMILAHNPAFWSIEDSLDPESPVAYKPFDATRDQFLGRTIIMFNGHRITVRDVIDHLANVEGAVHCGEPNSDRRKAIQAAGKFFSRDGLPGLVSLVRMLGRITITGLSPLREAVINSQNSATA